MLGLGWWVLKVYILHMYASDFIFSVGNCKRILKKITYINVL